MLCHCVRPQSFMNEHPDHRLKPFSSTSSFTKCNQGSFPASPFCQSVFYFAVSCKWITSLAFVARESLSETTSFFSLSYRKAGREKKYPMDRLVCISDPKVLQTINCHYCSFFFFWHMLCAFGTKQPGLSGLFVINVFCYCSSLLAICLTVPYQCVFILLPRNGYILSCCFLAINQSQWCSIVLFSFNPFIQ